jgi:cytosine/adenosine deaminase-related metal-dependent hydrolase
MCIVLKECRYVVKSFKPFQVVELADIAIDNGVVTCIGNCKPLQNCYELDCGSGIAVPGFVSMHTHVSADAETSGNSIDVIKKVLGLMLRYGYTAAHIVDADSEMLEDVCRLAKEIGMRISVGPLISSSKDLKKLSFLKFFKYTPYCLPSINISPVEDLDTNTLIAIKEFISSYTTPLHIHIASSGDLSKTLDYYRKTGSWLITALDSLGLLTEKTCIAHASWITTWEIERVKERDSCIVLTPFADVVKGVHGMPHTLLFNINKLCFGIDNPWHRPSLSPLLDIIALQAVYSNRTWSFYPDTLQILHYITTLGATAIGSEAGIIEVGKRADIAILHLDQNALNKSISGFLLRGLAYNTKYTVVEGRVVWRVT